MKTCDLSLELTEEDVIIVKESVTFGQDSLTIESAVVVLDIWMNRNITRKLRDKLDALLDDAEADKPIDIKLITERKRDNKCRQ